jgi:hypothetical protein
VLLGPTENRVARWLLDMTRYGRVTIRTADLAAATHVERSEAYRITARLRVLGLFGIQNDQGGTRGGRRFWRTATEHDGARLDALRHRQAWSRILAWARGRSARLGARLEAIRNHTRRAGQVGPDRTNAPTPAGVDPPAPAGVTFADAMRRHGLGRLMDQWRVS